MKIETEVTDCRDCPFRRDHRGQGECWTECGHEAHRRPAYGNILWGCQEQFQATPSWCPLGLASSPYMTPDQIGQLDRLLSKCIEENVSTWIASRINGASGAMIYSPNMSRRLLAAFDQIAERVKRGEGQT